MSANSQPESGAGPLNVAAPPAGRLPEVKDSRWRVAGVCVFLAAIIWLVFGQTLHHEFVSFDDSGYVYENPAVAHGLTLAGIKWSFTHVVVANWHPLTMMSHMLDCQIYGLSPGGHHLTNVLLHTATVILLFLVLRRMTGYLWRSAFVAAVFAIHPLRVESVAWVAERKDVLSGLFFMLTLFAYTCYAQRRSRVESRASSAGSGSLAPGPRPSTFDYSLVLLFFALGLMSKPMLVTVPLVLLLLDYWPLKRFPISDFRFPILRLVWEKLPLFGLAVASGVATIYAQRGAIQPFEDLPLSLRAGNALISYMAYIGQMFWPSGLAILYPLMAKNVGVSEVVLSLVLLAGITAGVIVLGRRCPWFLTGWLWYLIMLLPVIGVVQVGVQARADRYTYLPQIGLYLMLTWAAAELCAGGRHRRVLLGGGATVILAALIFCARPQASYWRNSETLWTHALACTSDNYIAHNSLGNALVQKGRVDEAIVHYQKALEIYPNDTKAHLNLGGALLQKGRVDEAIAHCQRALEINPASAEAHNNLGNALRQKGKVDEAIIQYQQALQINSNDVEAYINLGNALVPKGQVDEAITQYQQALRINPDYANAYHNFGNALVQKGRVDEAITHFQKALKINPDSAEFHSSLGNALFQKGRVDEAIAHFQQALQIKPDFAEVCYDLGNAFYQKGQVDEAMAHYQKALEIKPDFAEAHNNLGNAFYQKGQVDEAMVHYQKALQINPAYAEAHNNLGNTFYQKGQVDEAMAQYQKALAIKPDYAEAHNNLDVTLLLRRRKLDEAIAQYQKALEIKPDSVEGLNNLAWLLATCPDARIRDGVRAVHYAERACELTHYRVTVVVGTLAAAYAEAGRYDDALAAAQKACALAAAAGEADLLKRNRELLELYRAHQPYHEAAEKVVPATPQP